jgi:UDP-N-acetylmuramate dehydrogenase
MSQTTAALHEELALGMGARVRGAESLARHTSFRIGGPADLLVIPDDATELAVVVAAAAAHGLSCTLLGAGSNLLVGDGGIAGVVVKLGLGFRGMDWHPSGVVAGAAVQLGKLARAAVAHGLAGVEHAEGIPGTVGGAVFMNAGAYGGDVSGAIESVDGVDAEGALRTLSGEALAFGYRRAELPPGFIVTSVRFRLTPDDPAALAVRLREIRDRRVASQPHGSANAGSIFKNPAGDHAGRLIEAAGLKGMRVGRARISERHANFIVNEGGAAAADVQALMAEAQRAVWEWSGVWLEPEIRLVGRW